MGNEQDAVARYRIPPVSITRLGTRNPQIQNHRIIAYHSPPVAPKSARRALEGKFRVLCLPQIPCVLLSLGRWAEITATSSPQAPAMCFET
jgi:hypothetical protein